ncbi:MAG: aminomethyl-transferring glycine dehydrogenase subunit GcvPA [Bacteroidales bacterium]|nr:aminomethyl-transferring glycine dehydrogenase subunit GcvPA [Bacteroidales bacterium]
MSASAYFPHTGDDVRAMLSRIGADSLRDLYTDVPENLVYKGQYDLPEAMSEQEVRDFFNSLQQKDIPLKVFVGAGAYDHYVPSVIPYLTSRSEFLTAYTPYQAEISQGTLRYIFEYQSMICSLTGMDVSNASMYDGPTAAAEAMNMMFSSAKHKPRVLVSGTLLPNVLKVVRTYAKYHGVELGTIDSENGQTALASLQEKLSAGDVAGIIVPSVNRYGIVEDLSGFADAVHEAKALMAVYCDPSALAVVKSPGQWGADIAVGDGQSLGIPLSFGGPYVGFMACKEALVRKMPGRIVGETSDAQGRRCYCLTLQAREQHIRRQKATSNICSNESLMALWVTVYMSLMGAEGLRKVNELSSGGAHYLHDALLETDGFSEAFPGRPFLKEFTLKYSGDVNALQQKLLKAGYFAAYELEKGLLSFCVTEKRSKAEVDGLIKAIREA